MSAIPCSDPTEKWDGKESAREAQEVWTKGLFIISNLGEVVFETSWKKLPTASLGSIISDLPALQSPGEDTKWGISGENTEIHCPQ